MNFWEYPEVNVALVSLWLFPFVVYYCVRDIVLSLVPRKYHHKKDLTGQTVLITGAGSGIGREMAIEFSKYNVILVLLDLNKSSLHETEKLLDGCSKSFLYQCDVSKRENVYEVAKQIKKEVGKINILVNNAGIVNGKMLLDLQDEAIIKTMEVNTLAHFWMLKAFLPEMMEYNEGHIVCIASQAGHSGFSRLTDYCASKFAAVGLMESLQRELEVKELNGVKTTIVSPGLVSTGLFEGSGTPLTAFLNPDYVAREVVNGVLENKEVVMIPAWNTLILLFKLILPTQATQDFYKYLRMDFMSSFKGRSKVGDIQNKQL